MVRVLVTNTGTHKPISHRVKKVATVRNPLVKMLSHTLYFSRNLMTEVIKEKGS